MKMGKKKTIIISVSGLLLITFGIFLIFINSRHDSLKSIAEYDSILNTTGDVYQVKDGKNYLLLDASFKKIDQSNNEMLVIYDGYYVKNDTKNYYLMRYGHEVAKFDGSPIGSYEFNMYKDENDKLSKYVFIDGVQIFDDFYESDYDNSNYCVTKYGDEYLIYDSSNGTVMFKSDTIPRVVVLDNKYYGIIGTNNSINKIYSLASGLKSSIQLPGEIVDNPYISKYNMYGNFETLYLYNELFFVAKDSNGKYGLLNKEGNLAFDFKYDEVIYSPESNLVSLKQGSNYSLAKTDGNILYEGYSTINTYGDYALLYKEGKITVTRFGEKIYEVDDNISAYSILLDGLNNLIMSGNDKTIVVSNNNNVTVYDKRNSLLDYDSNVSFLYSINDDTFTLYNIENDKIISFPFTQKANYDGRVSIGRSKYDNNYFEVSFSYENGSDYKRYLYVVDIMNKSMVEDKTLYELQPIGESFYKLKEDNTFILYSSNLDELYTIKDISRVIKTDDKHFILIDEDLKPTLLVTY